MRLRAGEGLLRETFAHFRRCGRGRNECVVFWIGPSDDSLYVDQVVHPVHTSSPRHYEVDQAWAVEFALKLARDGRAVRLQAHIHPGGAFHSTIDDQHAVVSTPGFLSLVVPNCARGEISLSGCYLGELMADGCWRSVPPTAIQLES